jgi:molybdopterin/thiamine biosynthesis adenylyltransferase/molybdopterin synthase catalytic subunit/rhodanese-related sulfurtransferase
MFSLSSATIDRDSLLQRLADNKAGAIVTFEGWVRDHNQGKAVSSLEYQVYEELALKEGDRILREAMEKFNLHAILAIHRHGHLKLGEIAVWIGATASHRDDAFKATRYVIDEIKHRLPVWKKEHYVNEDPEWVFCKHHHHHVHFSEADYYQKQSRLVDQRLLKDSKVLIIGAGGLGCPALLALGAAGIGQLDVLDFDRIQISNIHRQVLYSPNLVGEMKAIVARSRLLELNPFVQSQARLERVDAENVCRIVRDYDLVLDCTDNMETKYTIHDACFKERRPLISASVFKSEGQLRTFLPGSEQGCLRCHVETTPVDHLLGNCNDFGVLGATTNFLGSLQASESIKLLLEGTNASLKQTVFFNTSDLSQIKVTNTRRIECPVCEGQVEFRKNEIEIGIEKLKELDAVLLDIRDISNEDIESHIDPDKEIVLCCHRGIRSKKVVENLRTKGYQHLWSLKGGAGSL